MKPTKQRRLSKQHAAVGIPQLELELQHILKQPVFQYKPQEEQEASSTECVPCQAMLHGLERLLEALQSPSANHECLFDTNLWKQVHGFLVLLLGGLFSVEGRRSFQEKRQTTTVLCQCLLQIHQLQLSSKLFSQDELVETFECLVQTVSRLGDLKSEESCCLLKTCLSILQRISVNIKVDLPKEAFRGFILYLTTLCVDTSPEFLRIQSLELLQTFQRRPCRHASRYAQSALQTVQRRPSSSATGEHGVEHMIFAWSCMAQMKERTEQLVQTHDVLNRLQTLALQDGPDTSLAVQAADCLSQLASNSPPMPSIQTTIIAVFTDAPLVVRERILPAICSLHARDGVVKALSWNDTKRLQSTLSALVQVLVASRIETQQTPDNVVVGVATFLLDCMRYDTQREASLQAIPQTEWMSICMVLLQNRNESVITVVVDCLCDKMRQEGARVIEHTPEVLSGLAGVLATSFSPPETKHTIVQSFHHLTETTAEASIVLARQPNVLNAILATAADDTDTSTKRLALKTLISLCKNVRNRRILARQGGVLACLIRHARDYDPYATDSIVLIERESLKEHIVLLAEAL